MCKINRRFFWLALPFFALTLLPILSWAQYNSAGSNIVVKMDTATHLPIAGSSIPFDQAFTISLTPKNPQNIIDVQAFKVISSHGRKTIPDGSLAISGVKYGLTGTTLNISFPAIKPDFHFDFCMIRQMDKDVLDTFMNYANFVAKSIILPASVTDEQKQKQDDKYNGFIVKLEKSASTYNNYSAFRYDYLFPFACNQDENTDCDVRVLATLFQQPIIEHYNAILNYHFEPLVAYPGGHNLHEDLALVSQSFRNEKYNDQTITSLIRITALNNGLTSLLAGKSPLNLNYQNQPVDDYSFNARLKNLNFSILHLNGLIDSVERIHNEVPVHDAAVERVINYLIPLAQKMNNDIRSFNSNYTFIVNSFQKNPYLRYTDWYVNDTDAPKDLQARSSTLFFPELGLTFLGVRPNEGGNSVIPKLTIGVNINFRPTDKNLNRDQIPKDIRGSIFSGFVGLTFGGFKNKEYSNLLSNNSLLTGLNVRLVKSLYFSFGASFYQQQNKNPIVNDFHTQIGAYAGLMLDIDIVSAASSVTSLIFK
jgi:hypothetical protein